MKKLYWRPRRISKSVMVVVAVIAVAGLLLVENVRVQEKQRYYQLKVSAAKLASTASEAIKAERLRLAHPINYEFDPAGTGLIGEAVTPVTTNPGYLISKRSSVNPNFAAVIVHLLKRAGLEKGDIVAVGVSGSFPGMNISVFSAISVLGLKPIIISSVGSSQWGANFPDFMWPDMEKLLNDQKIFPYRSEAVTRGGIDDTALGLNPEAIALIDASIARSGRPGLAVENYADSVEKRMKVYEKFAAGKPIAAYINIGGGTVSVGTSVGKKMFSAGLNTAVPGGKNPSVDSMLMRFASDGIPVIHLTKFSGLARKWDLPVGPRTPQKAGEGPAFIVEGYNRIMAAVVLAFIVLLMIAFVRMDWGYRIFSTARKDAARSTATPERMV